MSKGLNILTNRAQKSSGASKADRRTLPTCIEPGCRKKVEALPGWRCTTRCHKHMSVDEQNAYAAAWKKNETTQWRATTEKKG